MVKNRYPLFNVILSSKILETLSSSIMWGIFGAAQLGDFRVRFGLGLTGKLGCSWVHGQCMVKIHYQPPQHAPPMHSPASPTTPFTTYSLRPNHGIACHQAKTKSHSKIPQPCKTKKHPHLLNDTAFLP